MTELEVRRIVITSSSSSSSFSVISYCLLSRLERCVADLPAGAPAEADQSGRAAVPELSPADVPILPSGRVLLVGCISRHVGLSHRFAARSSFSSRARAHASQPRRPQLPPELPWKLSRLARPQPPLLLRRPVPRLCRSRPRRRRCRRLLARLRRRMSDMRMDRLDRTDLVNRRAHNTRHGSIDNNPNYIAKYRAMLST